MTGPDLRQLAHDVLSLVGDRAEAAVSVTRARAGLTRFANSFIHQNMVDEHVEVALQISCAGRPASAYTYRTDGESLASLAERALTAASLRPVDPSWPGLAPPAPLVAAADCHYDGATAASGPAERADTVAAFVEAGGGLSAAGFCETTLNERFFANSAGQRLSSRDTSAALDAIARNGRSDGVASRYSSRLADVDGAALGARAAISARRGTSPVELPAGDYEVVLSARCVAYIMDFLSVYAFNGKAVTEQRSFIVPGQEQFDSALSIWDDGTDPRHVGPLFDGEGTPKAMTPLVTGGRVSGVCHDRRTAAVSGQGASSTGQALPGAETVGAIATSLFMGPAGGGSLPPETLISRVGRGLLVNDFWYTRVLDPKTLVATGLTRNGVFMIEGGEVTVPVTNLRFTQSYAAALAPGRVLGVGNDGQLAPGGLHVALNHAPSLHLASWHFTGNASE
jgi:predicted Zn-dependent protease